MKTVVHKYKGKVFESQKVTKFVDPYPATDGIHYGPTEARGWAEKVSTHFREFMQVASTGNTETLVQALPIETPKAAPNSSLLKKSSNVASGKQEQELALLLKLVEKSELKNLADLDYANALGVYEYEVVKDLRGNYPFDRVRIAHGIVFGRKYTSAAKREIGSQISMVVVPLSKYKTLSTWQMVDGLRPNFELPIYTPKLE
ncbi:MAG: hypothetical protein P1U85_01560 [Verrucomicrobiales bacterium]|nr:hypothetical protein [Verrucomicrobiales bacterium]